MSSRRERRPTPRKPPIYRRGHSPVHDVRPGHSDAETVLFASRLTEAQARTGSAPGERPADEIDSAGPAARSRPAGAVLTEAGPAGAVLTDAGPAVAEPVAADPRPEAGDGWRPTPRRTWISRGVVACILVIQALLTIRMHNTAFEDEGL
jgi:hypothetical protein